MIPTEAEFRSSEPWRSELAEILKHPTLQMALAVIRSSPSEFPPPLPGVHYDLILSREHSRTVGINHALRKLADLTKPPVKHDGGESASERPQWADDLPPEMIEAIRKMSKT